VDKTKLAKELVAVARELVAARKAIEIRKIPGDMMETKSRYMLEFQGKPWGQLYYNMRGYVAERGIPIPSSDGEGRVVGLDIGEKSLSAFKREIGRANKDWSALR
jgi:hypothetical protein